MVLVCYYLQGGDTVAPRGLYARLCHTFLVSSGVTIGRARRAVHAGPALWGPKICPTLFLKKFFGEEGALLEYLHAVPLQPCYATASFLSFYTLYLTPFSFHHQ